MAATKKPRSGSSAKSSSAESSSARSSSAKGSAAKGSAAKSSSAKSSAAKSSSAKSSSAKSSAAKKAPTARSRRPSAAKAGTSAADGSKPSSARSRKKATFGVGDRVVHPQHGAALITKKVKQEVEGEKKDYYVLDIATDQLTVFVPVDNIEETIRSVISKGQARKVFQLFKEEPQDAGSNWSRWYKVLNEKMTSGDIYQVAEVVRDLTHAQQTKGISPALKRMLSRARLTLTSELRFALDVDEEEATRRLDRALPKAESAEGD